MLLNLALCLELAAAQSAATAAPPPDLDAWVARAMRTFDVPGLAVAIVEDDAVVVAKGDDVRRIGDCELTVHDLLAHGSGLGLGAGDLLWRPPSTYNRKDLLLKPARGGPPQP